jgi:hypothetical protein
MNKYIYNMDKSSVQSFRLISVFKSFFFYHTLIISLLKYSNRAVLVYSK